MKRAWGLAVVAVVVAAFTPAALGQYDPYDPNTWPLESIVNSAHNLNNYPGIDIPLNQVCLPCHVPHNALQAGEENVLWNHAETGQTFEMYYSGAGQPEGTSKKCLGCHDGVTALDSYGGTQGSVVIDPDSKANMGTDLSNDHPIGIEYPAPGDDFNDPNEFMSRGNSLGVRLVSFSGVERVECNSCHNPHNPGLGNFLRAPLEESVICLECHNK
ncbi:MAG: cytochrome c3 family protein [Phycisphaerales bacterium]|nr:cytochrome c3 family protein [Phycisphaerales bacterium]